MATVTFGRCRSSAASQKWSQNIIVDHRQLTKKRSAIIISLFFSFGKRNVHLSPSHTITMRTSAVLLAAVLVGAEAFAPSTLPTSRVSSTAVNQYIPSGFTAETWKAYQEKEKSKNAAKKNLGAMGPKGFKSRSFQSFQEALERGEAAHLMPVFNAEEKVRKGIIKRGTC